MDVRRWVLCCAVAIVGGACCAIDVRAQLSADGSAGERSVLTETRNVEAGAAPSFCRCTGETELPSMTNIKEALRGPLQSAGLDFTDTPLEEVLALLQDEYRIPIQLNQAALEDCGLSADEPVTINVKNISLRSALRLMLDAIGLTYVIRNEVLFITTPEDADSHLITCVYDVRTLTDDTGGAGHKALVDAITSCVATETWAVHEGGEARIQDLENGLIVVSQTAAIHEEISQLLTAISELRRQGPAVEEVAAGAAAPDQHDSVVTRSYLFQSPNWNVDEGLRAQLRDLIVRAIPDQRWDGQLDDGQAVVLVVLPDRIVLKHKQSVQRRVESLLSESGVAAVPGQVSVQASGGGGGFFQPAESSE